MAPRETENNAYAKFGGDKQRALWYVMVFCGKVNFQPIRNTSQIWVVKRHPYRESLRSFLRRHRGDTRDSVATCRLLFRLKPRGNSP